MICLVLYKLIPFLVLVAECIECISLLTWTLPRVKTIDIMWFSLCPSYIVLFRLELDTRSSFCLCVYIGNTRVNRGASFFVMNRVGPSWDPMDPNVLSVVDPSSDLGRDLAISLQATAEEEEEENNTGRLTDE